MAEYIEKAELIKKLCFETAEWYYSPTIKTIKEFPVSDVQPIRHGRWDFRGYQLFKCTNCKEMFTQDQLEAMQNHKDCEECTFPNFCPNCGARMDGDTNG